MDPVQRGGPCSVLFQLIRLHILRCFAYTEVDSPTRSEMFQNAFKIEQRNKVYFNSMVCVCYWINFSQKQTRKQCAD